MVLFVAFVLLMPIKPHLQLITCSLLMRTGTIICHSYKHKHLHGVHSLCIDQQMHRVCALFRALVMYLFLLSCFQAFIIEQAAGDYTV